MWAQARHALVVIEPGTPAGYARIIALRQQLIAAGAMSPRPARTNKPCPLIAPDWCHFAQRLPRSRDHRQVKGAEVPFEDEKFSYVVLTARRPRHVDARVLAPPDVTKAEITAKLCTADGVALANVARRDKAAYAAPKALALGRCGRCPKVEPRPALSP